MTQAQTILELTSARKGKYTDGPNADGYYTSGIDLPKPDIFGKPDWHLHAIEFHSKDKAEAEARRDVTFATLRATTAAAQPVAWRVDGYQCGKPAVFFYYKDNEFLQAHRSNGDKVTPLYASPSPLPAPGEEIEGGDGIEGLSEEDLRALGRTWPMEVPEPGEGYAGWPGGDTPQEKLGRSAPGEVAGGGEAVAIQNMLEPRRSEQEHRRYLDASRRADTYRKERDMWKATAEAEAAIGKDLLVRAEKAETDLGVIRPYVDAFHKSQSVTDLEKCFATLSPGGGAVEALDNSQSLLVMIHELGSAYIGLLGNAPSGIPTADWDSEGLTALLTEQISENRATLSALPPAQKPERSIETCDLFGNPPNLKEYDVGSDKLCDDCPPADYPTDKTRCLPCPRRQQGR